MIDQIHNLIHPDAEADSADAMREFVSTDTDDAPAIARTKLADALTPGFQAEFDPAEAEAAGAFVEDALSESDALASAHDAPLFLARAASLKTE
jgi:hypothetical protein